jgi:hypothetical protein
MSKTCLKQLTRQCLEEAPILLPFVTSSVDQWDPKSYFDALLRWNTNQIELGEVAFLPTDVALVVDDGLARHVQRFAKGSRLFESSLCQSICQTCGSYSDDGAAILSSKRGTLRNGHASHLVCNSWMGFGMQPKAMHTKSQKIWLLETKKQELLLNGGIKA